MIIKGDIKVIRKKDINKDYYKQILRESNFNGWVVLPHHLAQNKEYLIDNRCRTVFYQYLCSRAVRKPMKIDSLNIYNNYFKDNYLACNISVKELAKTFGYKTKCVVLKWIKELIERKYIVVDKVKLDGQRERSIYITGVHNNFKEYYFIYDIYNVQMKDIEEDTPVSNRDQYRSQIETSTGLKSRP